jgi:hypothetical protein
MVVMAPWEEGNYLAVVMLLTGKKRVKLVWDWAGC